MAYSLNDYVAGTNSDGSSYTVTTSTVFVAPPYLGGREATDIIVQVAGVTKVKDTDYTITNNEVKFLVNKLPAVGAAVRIQRRTSQSTRLVDYTDATLLKADTMDADANQLFFMAQEALDLGDYTTGSGVTLSSTGKIVGLGDVKIKPATGDDVVLDSSLNFARVKSTETSASLYFGADAGASAEKLQTTNTGITVTGDITCDDITCDDLTTASLSLTYDSSGVGFSNPRTILRETGNGNFRIEGQDLNFNVSDGSSPSFGNNVVYKRIDCTAGPTGAVELWHGVSVKKLETTATGINVIGTVDLDNLTIAAAQGTAGQVLKSTGSGIEWANDSGGETLAQTLALGNTTGGTNIAVDDDDRITLGAGDDLQIYHASGFNYILATPSTPSLNIGAKVGGSINLMYAGAAEVVIDGDGLKTNSGVISSQAGHDVKVQAAVGYGVNLTSSGGLSRVSATETQAQLFYGASAAAGDKKLETTSTGIDVTGTVTPSGGYNSSDGTAGYTGSAAASATLTIKNGLIVAVS